MAQTNGSRFDSAWKSLDLNAQRPLFAVFVAENKLKPLLATKIDDRDLTPNGAPIPKLMLSAVIGNAVNHGANLVEPPPTLFAMAPDEGGMKQLPVGAALTHRFLEAQSKPSTNM